MAKRTSGRRNTLPNGQVHPYARWEGTQLWKAVEKAVEGLVENQDLIEKAPREYVVGYICKVVERRKTAIVAQLREDEY